MTDEISGYYLDLLKIFSQAQQLYIKYKVSDVAKAIDSEIASFHSEFLGKYSDEELTELISKVSLELALQGYSICKKTKGGK